VPVPATPLAMRRRVQPPRATVRGRLTLLYGCVLLASGAALLAITYVLVDDAIPRVFNPLAGKPANLPPTVKPSASSRSSSNLHKPSLKQLQAATDHLVLAQRTADLHSLLLGSGIALGVMTVVSVLLGWLVAGRILRPLRTITNAARHISEESLDQRLALEGPADELKDLADIIDGLLERLHAAFEAQRQFVANAAHELRAPLTLERAMLQVTLADPGLTLDVLRATCDDVIDSGRQQEQLIEALLTLARSQRGLDHKEELDLAVIAGDVADARKQTAMAAGLQFDLGLRSAPVLGDAQLIQRLVANLLDNALHYNRAGGSVRMVTEGNEAGGRLIVTNSGPVVPQDQIARLLEPFQRVAPGRAGEHEGFGLGLSIVQAIVKAHGARLLVTGGSEGGLNVEIRFPARLTPSDEGAVSENGRGQRRPRTRDLEVVGKIRWRTRLLQPILRGHE
jgi:signal transduction histidine kinase